MKKEKIKTSVISMTEIADIEGLINELDLEGATDEVALQRGDIAAFLIALRSSRISMKEAMKEMNKDKISDARVTLEQGILEVEHIFDMIEKLSDESEIKRTYSEMKKAARRWLEKN